MKSVPGDRGKRRGPQDPRLHHHSGTRVPGRPLSGTMKKVVLAIKKEKKAKKAKKKESPEEAAHLEA